MRRHQLRHNGFTLLEVIIYGLILSILMTAMYLLLRTTFNFMRVTNATASLQASAQKAAVKITNELAQAHRGAGNIVVGTNPNGVVFLSPTSSNARINYDASGNIMWQRWVCFYYDAAEGDIMRGEIPITPTATPPMCPYQPSNFTGFATNMLVEDNATNFTVTLSGSATVVTVTAGFQETVNSPADYALQVTNQVLLRN